MSDTPSNPQAKASTRLTSIDALRGFDMFWIVGAEGLVSALHKLSPNPVINLVATQLEHKKWEVFAFEDLIFPLFVFIIGISIVFSLDKIVETEGKAGAAKRVFRRFVILYLIGLFYYGGLSKTVNDIRWVGVLQRLAFSYFGASLLYLYLPRKGLIITAVTILLGYWALLALVPVPGVGAGNFAEGKNLTNYIDQQYLPGRRWDGDHDPEGILSNFTAVVTCLLGVFTGLLLKSKESAPGKKVQILMIAGLAGVVVGWGWGIYFPVIKKLWTSSYVLVAAGYSAWLVAGFYWVVDIKGWQKWAQPFIWIGLNPITIYLSENMIPWEKYALRFCGGSFQNFLNTSVAAGVGDLLTAIIGLCLTVGLAGFLHSRKIYIRI